MKITWKALALLIAGWSLLACASDKKDSPRLANLGPQPPKTDTHTPPPPGPGEPASPKLPPREFPLKEEFSVTLVADSSVAQIDSINVDVISSDAKNAARLITDGPVKYRDSRIKGNTVKSHVFSKGGQVVLKVPSFTPANTIVLWAELAAPAQGSDTRMLEIPLTLDKNPAGEPLANPIKVKLTANGWQREN